MVQLQRWLQGGYFMWENPVANRPNIACVKNINNAPSVLLCDGGAVGGGLDAPSKRSKLANEGARY